MSPMIIAILTSIALILHATTAMRSSTDQDVSCTTSQDAGITSASAAITRDERHSLTWSRRLMTRLLSSRSTTISERLGPEPPPEFDHVLLDPSLDDLVHVHARTLKHFPQCYRERGELGQGGAASVYQAVPCTRPRGPCVAVKVTRNNIYARRELLFLDQIAAETSATSAPDQDYVGVPRLFDVHYDDDYDAVRIVMQCFHGLFLVELLLDDGVRMLWRLVLFRELGFFFLSV